MKRLSLGRGIRVPALGRLRGAVEEREKLVPRLWPFGAWILVLILLAAAQHAYAREPRDLIRGTLLYIIAGAVFIAALDVAPCWWGRLAALGWPRFGNRPLTAGVGSLRAALIAAEQLFDPPESSRRAPRDSVRGRVVDRIRSHQLRVGLVLASVAVSLILLVLLALPTGTIGYPSLFGVWLFSIGLYLAPFLVDRRASPWSSATAERSLTMGGLAAHSREVLLVLLLTLLAVGLRFWSLATIPDIVSGDEGDMGTRALTAARGAWSPFSTVLGFSTMYLIVVGLPMLWWGTSLDVLRLMSALPGALTVPATYLLARSMFGPVVAALAAVIVAVNHFHLHFSRIIVSGNVVDALFGALALWLLYRAVTRGRTVDFVLSGLVMGLHLYFYMGARLVILLAAGYMLLLFLLDRRRAQANLWNFGALLGMLAVVGAPMVRWMITNPVDFWVRASAMGIIQNGWLVHEAVVTGRTIPDLLWQQFVNALLIFNFFPVNMFYEASLPMFDHLAGAFLVLGATYSLCHTREPRFLLLNAWIGASVAIGGAALVLPHLAAYRVMILFPAVAIVVAIGVVKLLEAGARRGVLGRWSMIALLSAFVATTSYINVNYYFRDFMAGCGFEHSGTRLASRLGVYLGTLDRDFSAYLYGGQTTSYGLHPSVDFLSRRLPVKNMDNITQIPFDVPPPDLAESARAVFVFVPERLDQLDAVRERYPGGHVTEVVDCGRSILTAYELPPRAAT